MKAIVEREHERTSGAASVRTVQAETVDKPPPNPLWAISVGMAVFFIVVAALVAAGW